MKCPYTEAVQQLRNRRKIWPPSSVISLSSQSNFMVCAALALLSASMYNKNTVLSFTCHDLQLHTMHGYVIVVSSFWGVWLNLLNPPGYRPAIFYASAKVASMKHGFFISNLITYNTSYHQWPKHIASTRNSGVHQWSVLVSTDI